MNVANVVATRSTCKKLQVGAVVVKDQTIVATGYNGGIKNLSDCSVADHEMENGQSRTVHAEMNAIAQAAKNGVSVNEATIYVTASPCWNCFKLVANSGIQAIYYEKTYGDEKLIIKAALEANIRVYKLSPERFR